MYRDNINSIDCIEQHSSVPIPTLIDAVDRAFTLAETSVQVAVYLGFVVLSKWYGPEDRYNGIGNDDDTYVGESE
jgi:hypothetical protein